MQRAEEHAVADDAQRVGEGARRRVLEVDAAVGVPGDRRSPLDREVDAQERPDREQPDERGQLGMRTGPCARGPDRGRDALARRPGAGDTVGPARLRVGVQEVELLARLEADVHRRRNTKR